MAAGRIGWGKRVVFSLMPCVLLFGGAELVLRLVDVGGPASGVPLANPHDAAGVRIEVDPGVARQLPDTVLYNIRSNVLTRPDPELLFRVRGNPGGGPVHGYTGINAHGFRGRDPGEPRPPEARVVLLLGDSCAFGWGIRDHTQTLGPSLERALEQRLGPSRIFNLAQPGYSSSQIRRLAEPWIARLEPEIVILYLGWNDLWAARGLSDAEAMRALAWTRVGPLRWLRASRLYAALVSLRADRSEQARFAAAAVERRVAPEETVANVRSLIESARARGARVILIPPPFARGAPGSLAAMTEYVQLLALSFDGEVEFLSLPEMAPERRGAERFFLEDHYHPNEEGARYIAEALAQRIARRP